MAATEIDAPVARNSRWNYYANMWDIVFFMLGMSLISRETVMPLLVSTLTDSKLAIGLIPAVFTLGYYVPQLFSANFTERLHYKKPFVMLLGSVGERLPYLLIGLAVWRWAESRPSLTLLALFLLLAAAASSGGTATPAWYDLIAKVIPTRRRGTWSGVGHSIGAVLGIGGAFVVGMALDTLPYPGQFAFLFGLAFIFLMISWGGLSVTREPPSTVVKETVPLRSYLRKLPDILRLNHNYSRFLLCRSTVQLGTMATGFYMVFGAQQFAIDGATVGLLTGLLIASQAIMNLVWGFVGDRFGHKVVLTLGAFALALAAAWALIAPSAIWLGVTFVLVGAYVAADAVSSLNIILEFCAPQDRPTYIGLTNTLLAPVVSLAPILGGLVATWFGYSSMFTLALIVAVTGGLMLSLLVQEPRRAEARI